MIPVWVIALVAVLGAVCLALPLHIGMTGICLLLLAAVLLALRILKKKNAPEHWSRLLTGLTAAGMAVIFGAMGYIAVQGQDSIMAQDETPAFIVVLGAQVQGDGPSLTLKKRLDKTLTFMQEHPDKTVIVSGGQGPDEAHTEASVMARYLIEHGADASRVIEEDKASNTRENLLFSSKLAEAAGFDTSRVLIVTSDFHMCRAKYIARTLSMEPYGLASDTWPWILKVNYTLREVFAFAKAFWQARQVDAQAGRKGTDIMTDKDLRHLSRAELLDILYEQQKRYEDSLAENQALRQQLEDRTLRIASAGSIAEAAIQVNGVFEAAQAAADQYLASVKAATADMVQKTDEAQRQREAILQDAKQQADKIVQDAQAQADRLLTESAAQIDARWTEFQKNADALIHAHDELRMLIQNRQADV